MNFLHAVIQRLILSAFTVVIMVSVISSARADLVYTLTLDGCSSPCGVGSGPYNFGSVTLSQTGANTVHVVEMLNQSAFVATGAGNSLGWNLGSGITSVSISNMVAGFVALNPNGSVNTTGTLTPGSFKYSTFGNLGYTVTCSGVSCGPGASVTALGPLSFDLTAPGLSPSLFVNNANLIYFASDIIGPSGKTGNVAANTYTSVTNGGGGGNVATPEPTSVAVFAAALVALGSLLRQARPARPQHNQRRLA